MMKKSLNPIEKLRKKTKRPLTVHIEEMKGSCVNGFDFATVKNERTRLIYRNC